jgi:hypothetical protein
MQKKLLLCGVVGVLALAIACGGDSKNPASPSSTPTVGADAAADGSTLKVTAPVPTQPSADETTATVSPLLIFRHSTGKFVAVGSLTYRVQVIDPAGAEQVNVGAIPSGDTDRASYKIVKELAWATTFRWRARAEQGSLVGPWSAYSTFKTPAQPVGPDETPSFQRPTELWDRLTDGKTLGRPVNSVFIPGKGVQLPDFSSYVQYTLGATLTAGEMSFFIEGLDEDTNGGKTKVVTMQAGYGDFTANPYRFNVEKRGDDHPNAGLFRMRIITGDPETFYDSDRYPAPLDRARTYFMKVVWGSGNVRHTVQENDEKGRIIVEYNMPYSGTYRPNPHVVQLGVPTPRGGEIDATVPGIIIRYLYVTAPGGKRPGTAFLPLPEFGFASPDGGQ